MPAPLLPKSLAPNNWLSTAISGSTLNGGDTTRDQLAANSTSVTLVGGLLDDTYIAYDPSTKITEAANGGVDTVQTWGSGYTLAANVENLSLMGTGNSYATGNTGNNILTGNSGNNVITTGGGSDVLVGSGGADTYIPTKAANSITWITNFKATGATIDKIDVRGFGLAGFSSIQSRMTQIGTDVQIDLGNGQKVMLEGKTTSELTAANFAVEAAASAPSPVVQAPAPVVQAPAPNGLPASDLVMTFHDEFDTLNLYSTWKPTDGWGNRTLAGNKELELYVDPQYKGLGLNPFSVQNGILSITAAKTDPSLVSTLGGYQYTSGMLSSHASFSQQYGYFEMRAQMTTEQGMWPAFWMLATDGTWPPELDVVEVVGSNPTAAVQSVHTKTGTNSGKTTYTGVDLANGFHTYGMDWTASTITFYVDGQKTTQVATPADMNKPMYMMVNLAVGGNWPGSPDGTTDWSQTSLKVDYIRAYKHDPNAVQVPAPVPAPTPAPVPPPAPELVGFKAVLSNALDQLDLTSSYKAAVTGPNTSTTYSASQLGVAGIDSSANATVAYDANGGITVTNNAAWGAIKNATIKNALAGSAIVKNFVAAELALGNGDHVVSVTDSARGSITTGTGNDAITVLTKNDNTGINLMKINTGDGNNGVTFSGAVNTKADITTGIGSDFVTLSGQADATVNTGDSNDTITLSGATTGMANGGSGDDRFVISSTGLVNLTGGTGRDTFEFAAGVHATITDFNASEDKLVLNGIATGGARVSAIGGNTVVDLGNGSSVTLAGVSVSSSTLGLAPPPMTVTISNGMDPSNLAGAFNAPATGAGTSTIYTAAQLKLAGMDPNASASVAYDASNGLTVTNRGIWNGIKNARVETTASGNLTLNNFVDTQVTMGNDANTVKVTSAKRGTITTGAGNDQITVTGLSNGTTDNVMKINAGEGNNTISFSGASNTKTAITTGAGTDSITISGQAGGSVNAGAGNDRIVTATNGAVTLSGGAGKDVFDFIRTAHATISDFNASEDSIVIRGGTTSNVQVKAGAGYTLVDLGNGASVTLAGISASGSTINIAYA